MDSHKTMKTTRKRGAAEPSVSTPARVRRSACAVMEVAQHVQIQRDRVASLVERMDAWGSGPWLHSSPVQFDDLGLESRLSVALVFNSISFCYWPAPWWDNTWYDSKVRRGSWALLGAIRHAVDDGVPLLSTAFLKSISTDGLSRILDARGRLALLARRADILREVGAALDLHFGSRFIRMVECANFDASRLVDEVVGRFPSFKDKGDLDDLRVTFAKRAQLLAADCHRILEDERGHGLRGFEELTACADYMLPALLASEGLLVYSDTLREAIERQVPVPAGERWELEIRAATIVACDLLAATWGRTAMDVNDALWEKAGEVFAVSPSHHRTWTEAY